MWLSEATDAVLTAQGRPQGGREWEKSKLDKWAEMKRQALFVRAQKSSYWCLLLAFLL